MKGTRWLSIWHAFGVLVLIIGAVILVMVSCQNYSPDQAKLKYQKAAQEAVEKKAAENQRAERWTQTAEKSFWRFQFPYGLNPEVMQKKIAAKCHLDFVNLSPPEVSDEIQGWVASWDGKTFDGPQNEKWVLVQYRNTKNTPEVKGNPIEYTESDKELRDKLLSSLFGVAVKFDPPAPKELFLPGYLEYDADMRNRGK